MAKESLIYIITNPAYPENCVKIGYTTDLKGRLRNFNTSSIDDFEVFATYDVPNIENHKPDQMLHKLLTKLDPTLKVKPNKEFYYLFPEDAYEILKYIAIMHDRTDSLHLYKELKARSSEPANKEVSKIKGNVYYVKGAQLLSEGNGKYTLLKGSTLHEWGGNPKNVQYKKQQDNLLENGGVLRVAGKMKTQVDLTFASPSGAADLVYCCSKNGWITWKNKDKKTLDEIERRK